MGGWLLLLLLTGWGAALVGWLATVSEWRVRRRLEQARWQNLFGPRSSEPREGFSVKVPDPPYDQAREQDPGERLLRIVDRWQAQDEPTRIDEWVSRRSRR